MGNEIWIYYVGTNWDHASRVDLHPGGRQSAVSRAILRLDTSAGGEAFVEIRDLEGNPIDGFSLEDSDHLGGNNVAFPVSWKGSQDVSSLAGKEVKLHFKLRNCKLYAFQFQE